MKVWKWKYLKNCHGKYCYSDFNWVQDVLGVYREAMHLLIKRVRLKKNTSSAYKLAVQSPRYIHTLQSVILCYFRCWLHTSCFLIDYTKCWQHITTKVIYILSVHIEKKSNFLFVECLRHGPRQSIAWTIEEEYEMTRVLESCSGENLNLYMHIGFDRAVDQIMFRSSRVADISQNRDASVARAGQGHLGYSTGHQGPLSLYLRSFPHESWLRTVT